jgi:hypothetical protein
MEKVTRLPRVITSDGHHAIEIADGVLIRWWNKGGVWSVEIKSTEGMDVIGTRIEEAAAVH